MLVNDMGKAGEPPLLSDPKCLLFWIMKEFGNRREHKPVEAIGKLREAEIVLAQGGMTSGCASRRIAVT